MSSEAPSAFSRRSLGWILGLSIGSLLFALVLVALPGDTGEPLSAGSDVFSYSAVGHKAAVELLRKSGFPVHVRRSGQPGPLGPHAPLVIAEPALEMQGEGSSTIDSSLTLAGKKKARVLLILPKWSAIPDEMHPRWAGAVVPRPVSEVVRLLAEVGSSTPSPILRIADNKAEFAGKCETRWGHAVQVSLRQPRLLEPDESLNALVMCGGKVLLALFASAKENREIYLLSDPDLINNQGLGRAENAVLVRELFLHGLGARSAVWDETAHGFERAEGLVQELFRMPLAPLTAQAALVLGLTLWAGVGRFGKPAQPPPPVESGKRMLVDNIAKLMSLSGRIELALPRYLDQTLKAVAERCSLPAGLSDAQILARLQRIGAARGVDFDLSSVHGSVWALEAGRVQEALNLARELHRWREEMTRVH